MYSFLSYLDFTNVSRTSVSITFQQHSTATPGETAINICIVVSSKYFTNAEEKLTAELLYTLAFSFIVVVISSRTRYDPSISILFNLLSFYQSLLSISSSPNGSVVL